jgi:hypothetical protein
LTQLSIQWIALSPENLRNFTIIIQIMVHYSSHIFSSREYCPKTITFTEIDFSDSDDEVVIPPPLPRLLSIRELNRLAEPEILPQEDSEEEDFESF